MMPVGVQMDNHILAGSAFPTVQFVNFFCILVLSKILSVLKV